MNSNQNGYVYILSNPAMPGLLKIGYTTRTPEIRIKDDDLKSTGIPCPFVIEYYDFFDNAYETEKKVHAQLKKYHYRKEFFKCDLAIAVKMLQGINKSCDKFYYKNDNEERIKLVVSDRQKKEYEEKERIDRLERQKRIKLQEERLAIQREKTLAANKVIKVSNIIIMLFFSSYIFYSSNHELFINMNEDYEKHITSLIMSVYLGSIFGSFVSVLIAAIINTKLLLEGNFDSRLTKSFHPSDVWFVVFLIVAFIALFAFVGWLFD